MDKNKIDMTTGAILPKMLKFALPLMLSSVLQMLFNAADVIVVGQFGSENSLAAVGTTGILIGFFASMFIGLSIGSTVLASNYLGAGNRTGVSRIVHVSLGLALALSVVLTVFGFASARFFLELLHAPAVVMPLALQYMYVVLPGVPGMAVYNFGAALLRAKGDTRRPLYFLLAAGIVNALLNLYFVICWHMDVAGVALATSISQYLSAGLVVFCLVREKDEFRLHLKLLHLDRRTAARILRIGVPAAFQSFVFYIANFIIQAQINTFGPVIMSGTAAAVNLENFVWVSMNGFQQAGMTFVSQNLGAGKYERIDQSHRTAIACAFVTGMVLGGGVVFFGRQLLSIYTSNRQMIEAGMTRLYMLSGVYGICGIMECLAADIRGLGWSTLPSVISMIGACGFRLLWIFTLYQLPRFHTTFWLFLTYPVSWIDTIIPLWISYRLIRSKFPRTSMITD